MVEMEQIIQKIRKGVVIDNIPSGNALAVMNLLMSDLTARVVIALNVDSAKLGKKDIIKIEGKYLTSREVNFISLVAPTATINIIEDWVIKEKRQVKLPTIIDGTFKCPSPSCTTNSEHEPKKTKFKVCASSETKDLKLQCTYCGTYLYSGAIMNFLASTGIGSAIFSREKIENTLLDVLLKKGALKIVANPNEPFILKSGRPSAYFINIGTLTDGASLVKIKWALASFIALLLDEEKLKDFDFIFGPAYKGINLATLACEGLNELYGINKRYLYDRKEEKGYGDVSADKIIVGADHFKVGQKILLIDDVVTTGGTKVESLEKLKLLGAHEVVGLVLVVDRQEKMGDVVKIDKRSAVDCIQEEFGIKVFSILDLKTIFDLVKDRLSPAVRQFWIDYSEKYGAVKLL
jgi:aspartate carbamoyltransferase regulatory subunit